MDALYLILQIEGGLGLFTTTYDGRLVFNSKVVVNKPKPPSICRIKYKASIIGSCK
jgi:hypothetical protein